MSGDCSKSVFIERQADKIRTVNRHRSSDLQTATARIIQNTQTRKQNKVKKQEVKNIEHRLEIL